MKHANTADDRSTLPAVVAAAEWQRARDALRVKEKHERGE
jgi:hypothetical protein